MAVKGYLTIEEDDDGIFTLEKTGRDAALSAGERAAARKLFANRYNRVELKQENHSKLRSAQKALQKWLRSEFEKVFFVLNRHYLYPGLGLSAVAIVALAATGRQPDAALFLCFWLSGWTVAIYFLGRKVWRAWQGVLSSGGRGLPGALFMAVKLIEISLRLFISGLFRFWAGVTTSLGDRIVIIPQTARHTNPIQRPVTMTPAQTTRESPADSDGSDPR